MTPQTASQLTSQTATGSATLVPAGSFVPTRRLPGESRMARRMRVASLVGPSPETPVMTAPERVLATGLRNRSARRVRTCLRRMDPAFVVTPRWSGAQRFLEDVALDLAVGEPAIGCRTVGFRPSKARGTADAWPFVLDVLTQLGRSGAATDARSTAIDRPGFRAGVALALEAAHDNNRHRVALLLHGIQHMPVEALGDLVAEWSAYRERHPEGVRVALLLAGSEMPTWIEVPGLQEIELEDFSEAETTAALIARCGPIPARRVRALARFTGGVPEVVDVVSGLVAKQGSRLSVDQLLMGMGPVADEMRGALDIVSARNELADRLDLFHDGVAHPELPRLDPGLIAAGLLKRVRTHGQSKVTLRAPVLAALMG